MTGYGLALDYQGRYYAADNARRTAEATLDRVRALEVKRKHVLVLLQGWV